MCFSKMDFLGDRHRLLEEGSGLGVSTPSSGFHLNACSQDIAGRSVDWGVVTEEPALGKALY